MNVLPVYHVHGCQWGGVSDKGAGSPGTGVVDDSTEWLLGNEPCSLEDQ